MPRGETRRRLEGAGVALAYRERGAGPAVLLVHGIGDTAQSLLPALEELSTHGRAIAYDRRGYGDSGAPEPYERTTVNEQTEDAVALLEGLEAVPAIVCGFDFGALVCLDLLLRHRDLVTGAVLIAPPLHQLVPEATEALAAERVELEQALRDGGPPLAVRSYLLRRGAGADRIERAVDFQHAFFADYGGFATLEVSRRELRALGAPVLVLDGEGSPAHTRAAAGALARLVPGARREAGGDPVPFLRELCGGA